MTPLVIHGHFYQPPRDNPWTGAVEREPGAQPFHDWNERIHRECYRPNAFARVLDGYGRIERIVNNYQHISFNFGPTLISWIAEHDEVTYQRILAADRASARKTGHGNALGQAYGHAILPLCNARDKRTHIRWGIADFRARFGRMPEALWLPETACDAATLSELVDHGLRFAVLAPTQAARVRPAGGAWRSVADGGIDPGHTYRWLHPDGSGRSLVLFFYDGPIARSIAFEGALASSQALVASLLRAPGGEERLVHVATDGESYGHHFHFGDLSLAHALCVEAPARGLEPTNYGAFLDRQPPRMDVEIAPGPGGEGTSWSCAHGVSRWIRDCGCQTGGREGWNQTWRTPLRTALDVLRDAAAVLFEDAAADLFSDPWASRDAYVELLLDPDSRGRWLDRHARRPLGDADWRRALTLLEAQRHALLMYASCGWFFSDVSGIETVEVLRYAGRAIELLDELGMPVPRDRFLEALAEARSNSAEKGNGADVYRRAVEQSRVSAERTAAHVALAGLVGDGEDAGTAGGYAWRCLQKKKEQHGRLTLSTARIQLEGRMTGARSDHAVASVHFGGVDLFCARQPDPGPAPYQAAADRLWQSFRTVSLPTLLRLMREEFGPDEWGPEGLLPEGRQRVFDLVFGDLVGQFVDHYTRLYQANQRILEMLQDAGFDLPPELRAAAEFTLGHRFHDEIDRAGRDRDPAAYRAAVAVAEEAERRGYRLDRAAGADRFARMLAEALSAAVASPSAANFKAALDLADLARTLRLDTSFERVQEILYEAIRAVAHWPDEMRAMAVRLGLSPAAIQRAAAEGYPMPPGPPG
jgi:alpha-amylase/alpha-mannosidase (GH57 family)